MKIYNYILIVVFGLTFLAVTGCNNSSNQPNGSTSTNTPAMETNSVSTNMPAK